MNTTNSRDVSLVIRAKNQAEKTIRSTADALDVLGDAQQDVASSAEATNARLRRLGKGLSGLETVSKKMADSVEASSAAVSRQAQSLISTNAAIRERKARVEELTRAMTALEAESGKAFVGPSRFGAPDRVASLLKETRAQLKSAEADVARLGTTFDRQLSGLQTSREALRDIRTAQAEAERAVVAFSAEIATQTRLLDENARAAQRAREAATVMGRVDSTTGVSRSSASEGGATFEALAQREIAWQLRRQEAAREAAAAVRESIERASGVSAGSASDRGATFDALEKQLSLMERQREELNLLAEAEKTLAAIQRNTGTGRRSATESGASFQALAEAARAADDEAEALRRLRDQMNPLAALEARLATETAKLVQWQKQGKIAADELRQATKLLNDEFEQQKQAMNGARGLDSRGRPSLFGLKPYELQNLSFQINDIFTQLASGASITQTLAQQGGQILQIFPRAGEAIASALSSPVAIGLVATIGTLVLGIRAAASEAEKLRILDAALTLNADGIEHSAAAMLKATDIIDRYGTSAEDAIKIVRMLAGQGLDDNQLVEFGKRAKDTADVLGIDVPAAAEMMREAFFGGFDAVDALDRKMNLLTDTQREQIRSLYEQGRATEAQALAWDIFSSKMAAAAQEIRGPWTEALIAAAGAWQTFTQWLGDTGPISDASRALDDLGRTVARLFRRLSGDRTIADIEADLKRVRAANAAEKRGGGRGGYLTNDAAVAALETELALAKRREAMTKANGKATAEASEAQKKATRDLEIATDAAAESSKKATAAERTRAAEAEARRKAEKDVGNDGRFARATDAAKQEYIATKVAEARRKIQKDLADEAEREARARKQTADQQRRANIDALQNNRRQDLVKTARQYEGYSENNSAQRGDLTAFFRQNGVNIDPKMTAWCAAFVNAVLAANGLEGTGKLNARSFLGYGKDATNDPQQGDIVVLRRGNNDAQGHVGFFQGFDAKGNVRVLGGNQGDKVSTQSFDKRDVLGIRRAPTAGEVATEQAREDEQRLKRQQAYAESLDNQIERREVDTRQLRDQLALQGEALIAKQREAAIEDAITKARQDAEKAGVDTSTEEFANRIARLREVEGAYQDAARARDVFDARRDTADRPVDDLTGQRDALRAQIDSLRENGLGSEADALLPALNDVNAQLRQAIDNAIEFYEALNPGTPGFPGTQAELDAIIAKLQTAKLSTTEWITFMGVSGQQIAQQFTSGAVSALDRFSQAVANGANAFGALWDSFRAFAGDFLQKIVQMIEQQIIFNLVSGLLKSVAGGFNGTGFSQAQLDAGQIFHEGGVVGQTAAPTRLVMPEWFERARRYHLGGIAGLAPNEVPAILEQGEEVLTRDDPRHRANGGASGGGGNATIVNVFDPAEAMEQALRTPAGERVLINWITNNRTTFKAALG